MKGRTQVMCHNIRYMISHTIDVNLDHLVEECFPRFLHCKATLFSLPFLSSLEESHYVKFKAGSEAPSS